MGSGIYVCMKKPLPKLSYDLLRCTFEIAADNAFIRNQPFTQVLKSDHLLGVYDNGETWAIVQYRKYPGGVCKKALTAIPKQTIEEWSTKVKKGESDFWRKSLHDLRKFCE